MDRDGVTIRHQEKDDGGAFFYEREGRRLAEMTYRRIDEGRMELSHTETHESLRGLGVARKLLDAAVGWARATGTRFRVTCPYAKAQFEKDTSIRDVLA